jgi:hypothetical protein
VTCCCARGPNRRRVETSVESLQSCVGCVVGVGWYSRWHSGVVRAGSYDLLASIARMMSWP